MIDRPVATMGDLERLLTAAFAADPSAEALGRMDVRLAHALDLGPDGIGRRALRTRRAGWMLLAAAAIVVIGGAGVLALQRFEDWSAPDFDIAWKEGTVVGISALADGYEVTLERAYADAGQIMLAIAVEDLEQRAGTLRLESLAGSLVDEDGEEYEYFGGMAAPVDAFETLELWYLEPTTFPMAPGRRSFTLTLETILLLDEALIPPQPEPDDAGAAEGPNPFREVEGPWTIDFELEVGGGTLVEPEQAADRVGEVEIRVLSLLITPTRARLELAVDGVDGPGWEAVEVTARRDDSVIDFSTGGAREAGTAVASALEGVDDPAGTWTVTIGELVGPPQDGERLTGPWTIEVVVP